MSIWSAQIQWAIAIPNWKSIEKGLRDHLEVEEKTIAHLMGHYFMCVWGHLIGQWESFIGKCGNVSLRDDVYQLRKVEVVTERYNNLLVHPGDDDDDDQLEFRRSSSFHVEIFVPKHIYGQNN